ncbi:MAG: AraC family transcriptional regulator [Eubacterium ramulus]
MAAYVGLSRSYLCRAFQAVLGKSPQRIFKRIPDQAGMLSS